MNDTDLLVALVHTCGIRSGSDPAGKRTDCPFCEDRIDLCRAWLAGFSLGRATLPDARPSSGTPTVQAGVDDQYSGVAVSAAALDLE